MSKKNKKFKRNKSHNTPASSQQTSVSQVESDNVSMETGDDTAAVEAKKPEEVDPYTHNQYDHVKKDVRKILFIIGILALIFAGVWILGAKTNVLTSFGGWIYKVANIQTQ